MQYSKKRSPVCWPCKRINEMWELAEHLRGGNIWPGTPRKEHLTYCYSKRFIAKAKHTVIG